MRAEIGIFDSGVGGISFLAAAKRLLPGESFVYFGDLANAPYGGRSREFILARARAATRFFMERGVKAMVIACNTATAAAVSQLRAENPGLPVLGMEPAVHLAVKSGERRIIALATAATVRAENTRRLLVADAKRAEIIPQAAPGLVELIENEPTAERDARICEYLRAKLDPLLSGKVGRTALVLGCTHYIFLRPLLAGLYPQLPLYDGNLGTARNLAYRLRAADLLCGGGGGEVAVFGLPQKKFRRYLKLAENIADNIIL